ncbi:MAG: cyclic nucleotide-binding domain-containing protein [Ignavibacteriales bacterium]|nr:cyclic nucleotide-binding domain-containing protein [Ignavibacteriales bacterium]
MRQKKIINQRSSFWANLFKRPTEMSELKNLLRSIPPFEKLSSKYLNQIIKLTHNRNYEENEFIFYQGDPGMSLYIVRSGGVVVSYLREDNTEINLAEYSTGDFFGELALIDGDTRAASAYATEKTNLTILFKPDLDDFIKKYPNKGIEIQEGIMKIITTRLRNIYNEYFELSKKIYSEDKK